MYKKKYLNTILLFSAIVPNIITSDAMAAVVGEMGCDENAHPNIISRENIYGAKTPCLFTPKKKRVLGRNNVPVPPRSNNETSEIDALNTPGKRTLETSPDSTPKTSPECSPECSPDSSPECSPDSSPEPGPIERETVAEQHRLRVGDNENYSMKSKLDWLLGTGSPLFKTRMIQGVRSISHVVHSKIQTAHDDPEYKDPLQFVSLFIDKLYDASIYHTSELSEQELKDQFDLLSEYVDELSDEERDMVWGAEGSKMKTLCEIHASAEGIDFNSDFNNEFNPGANKIKYDVDSLYNDYKKGKINRDNLKQVFSPILSSAKALADEKQRLGILNNPKFRSLFERYYGDETPDYSPQKQIRSDSDSDSSSDSSSDSDSDSDSSSDSDFNALGTREGWDYESQRSIESFSEEEEGSRPHKSKPKPPSKTSTTTLYPEEDYSSPYYYDEEDYPETLETTASKESDSTAIAARPYTEESFSEEEEESISHKPKPKAPSKTSTTTLYPEEDSPSSYYYGEEDYPETLETTASKESDSTAIEAQANIEESKSLALNDAIYSITESVIRNINSVNIYNNIAIAAGDNNPKAKRIWSRGFAAHSKQSGDNQFKVGSCGVSIGGDIDIIEDKFILGAVFTKAGTKAQILNSSDMKLTSNIWSIYTRYNIGDNFVMDGDVSYGRLKVKGLEEKGKNNNGDLFKASASISHKIRLNDNSIIVMPNFGMTYDHGSVKYKKSDIKYSNLSGNIGLSIGLAGLKLGNNVDITPSIHAGAKHIISQKKSNISISNINYNSISAAPTYKSHKDIYNIGASMDIRRNHAVTLGVGYDCNFRKQYKSHSGFIKVEVKF